MQDLQILIYYYCNRLAAGLHVGPYPPTSTSADQPTRGHERPSLPRSGTWVAWSDLTQLAWQGGGSLFLGPLGVASGNLGFQVGTVAVSVLEEPFVVRNYLIARRRGSVTPDNPVPPLRGFLRGVLATHLQRRAVDWISHAAVDDVRVAVSYLSPAARRAP